MAEGVGLIIFLAVLIIVIFIIILIFVLFVFKLNGTSSSSSSAVTCGTLPQPANLQAISYNVSNIKATWSAVPGTSKYRLYVGTVPEFSPANAISSTLTVETTAVVSGLVLGQTYYLLVQAVNACNQGGALSQQVSVNLGFPTQFQIVSRAQPSLSMKINNTFNAVDLEPLCSGTPGDDLCIWSYVESSSEIVSTGTPLDCMKSIPPTVSNNLVFGTCTDNTYVNYVYNRAWTYDNITGAICHATTGGNTPCIKSNGPLISGQPLILAQYDGSSEMQWDIVQA